MSSCPPASTVAAPRTTQTSSWTSSTRSPSTAPAGYVAVAGRSTLPSRGPIRSCRGPIRTSCPCRAGAHSGQQATSSTSDGSMTMTTTASTPTTSTTTSTAPGRLAELAGRYARDGYLVVPGVLDPATLRAVTAEATAICRGERGAIEGTSPAAAGESDEDVLRRHLCLHFPHKVSAVLEHVARRPAVVDLLTAVIGPNVKLVQTMLFIKSEGRPGQAWHQDEYFIPTRDRSLTGGWIALDDATVENGCLWVIPGSHKHGIIWPTHYQKDMRFDCTEEAFNFPYRDEDAVPVEVKAGTIVFFNGYLLHRSLPNVARSGYRRALVNHYMSAESMLPWFSHRSGEPAGRADHRDIVLVAGKDPYAYKGTIDVMESHVRPEKQGGCGSQDQNLISTGAAAFALAGGDAAATGGAMGGAMGGVMILDDEEDDD